MRVFCSYANTGEDITEVTERMKRICRMFDELNISVYCDLFDRENAQLARPQDFLRHAIEKMRKCDTLFVVNTSARRSEGMLIEIGVAIERGMNIVYAQHSSSDGRTYAQYLANERFVWQTDTDLLVKTKQLFSQRVRGYDATSEK